MMRRTLMTACVIGTLAACGLTASGQTGPPSSGSNFPLYWSPSGPEDANINFSGLPIQRGKAHLFYEQCFGKYPRVWTDPETGRNYVENEGIPQKTNWPAHLAKLRRDVEAGLPDPNWDGLAILDFEGWHPNWEVCWNQPMKTMSRNWVRTRFPALTAAQVEQRAHEEFEAAGISFMVRTIQACKALRPRAKWGFYGYPYNFYSASQQEDFRPIFDAVDAFFPPMYATAFSVPDGTTPQTGQRQIGVYQRYVETQVRLVKSIAAGRPIYPLVWMRYHDMNATYTGQFINDLDVRSMFTEPWRSGTNGAVFWDVFNDPAVRVQYNSFFAGRGGAAIRGFMNLANPPQVPQAPATAPIAANPAIRVVQPMNKAAKMAPAKVLTAVPVSPRR